MKRKIFILLCVPLVFSGCSSENFFDIQSSMKSPDFTKQQQNLIDILVKYLGSDFSWGYCMVNDRYCAISDHKFDDDNVYKIMFCHPENDPGNLHILFLREGTEETRKIFGEIVGLSKEIEKIYFKDIDDDGIDEILICKNTSNPQVEVYRFNESKIEKIKIINDFIN